MIKTTIKNERLLAHKTECLVLFCPEEKKPSGKLAELDAKLKGLIGSSFKNKRFGGKLNPEPFTYAWSMTGSGEMIDEAGMMQCMGMSFCEIRLNMLWLGNPTVTVTVTDWWGVEASSTISFPMWNNYSSSASGDCWEVDYDVYYNQMMPVPTNFTDADDVFDQELPGSNAKWDSICTFNLETVEILDGLTPRETR